MQSLGRAPNRHAPHLRRDPSPSRSAYRMQRLWLTPLFRVLVRFGLPVLLVAAVAGLVFYDEGRRTALAPVSYTHLDVYKRQALCCAGR